jgi:multiple sugar transport system permease protein
MTITATRPVQTPATRRAARPTLAPSGTRTLLSDADLRRGRSRTLYWLSLGGATVLVVLVFFVPLYFMVTGAMKSPAELADPVPTIIPSEWHPENFAHAWTRLDIAHFLANTAFYAIGGWLIQIIVDVAAAYALSKLRPIFGKLILGLMLASLMLPAAALLVPSYLTVVDVPIVHLNLLNTPWALWLPGAANAFNIYVLKRFFDQIPNDLLEAASIDGAGRLRMLWSVVLPLSRPVLAVISIFAVIGAWKDFLWPLLVLQDPEKQTISVALSRLSFTSTAGVTQDQMFAGLAIASIPMVIIFAVFQRSILNGLSAGAIKG